MPRFPSIVRYFFFTAGFIFFSLIFFTVDRSIDLGNFKPVLHYCNFLLLVLALTWTVDRAKSL